MTNQQKTWLKRILLGIGGLFFLVLLFCGGVYVAVVSGWWVPPLPPQLRYESVVRGFPKTEISIIDLENKKSFSLAVEVADTPKRQEMGLMTRPFLAQGRGMIFPFDPPQQVSFWMKNTLFPLDMIFIDAGGRVVSIVPNCKPVDETPIFSPGPVWAVLEIGGGQAAALGIKVGDLIQ